MNATSKKVQVAVLFVFFFLGVSAGLASAAIMTVDGKEDAGLDFGVAAFARYVDAATQSNTLLTVPPTPPPFSSAADAIAFADAHGLSQQPWLLRSAGDIWSPTDTIVGESLTGLDAGTYRIAPVAGAYMYDSWNWDDASKGKHWWQLWIRGDNYSNGQFVNSVYDDLGSPTGWQSAADAFQNVQGDYVDITLAQGGTLNFWISDNNSLDNAGALSFSVTSVPEPSTVMLLALGLPFLLWGARRRGTGSIIEAAATR